MAKKPTNKTVENKGSVPRFLKSVADPQRRKDCETVAAMMEATTKAKPAMWGTSIVGFGKQHYKYESGREGDWFTAGFSPRKDSLTLYLTGGFRKHGDLLDRLGKYKTGKSCLYIKRLDDVDQTVLKELIARSVKSAKSGDWSY
jgi:hypothetical protein